MNREGEDGREGMVLLQPERSEVPDGSENKQSNEHGVLEDHWERQRNPKQCDVGVCWNEEDFGFLQRKSPQR